jgi:hypothetical protein
VAGASTGARSPQTTDKEKIDVAQARRSRRARGHGRGRRERARRLLGQRRRGAQAQSGRFPLLLISPFARRDHVDHNLSNLASIPNLVEYNWRLPSIDGSADQLLAAENRAEGQPFDLAGLFRFRGHGDEGGRLILNPTTAQPIRGWRTHSRARR